MDTTGGEEEDNFLFTHDLYDLPVSSSPIPHAYDLMSGKGTSFMLFVGSVQDKFTLVFDTGDIPRVSGFKEDFCGPIVPSPHLLWLG